MASLPRPGTGFSGTAEAEVLAYETERMLKVHRADADPGNSADWTITWTLEPEGRGTRLFLVHEGFDPDDPAQAMAHKIMDGGRCSQVMEGLERVLAEL